MENSKSWPALKRRLEEEDDNTGSIVSEDRSKKFKSGFLNDAELIIQEDNNEGNNSISIGVNSNYVSKISPVLQRQFQNVSDGEKVQVILRLPDDKPVGLRLGRVFIEGLYGEDLTDLLDETEAWNFAILTNKYQVAALYRIASVCLGRFINFSNCRVKYSWSEQFGENFSTLRDIIVDNISRHLKEAFHFSDNWTATMWERILDLEWNEDEAIEIPPEIEFFNNLMRWGKVSPENNAHLKSSLFIKVRFPLMTSSELLAHVQPLEILCPNDFEDAIAYSTNDIAATRNPQSSFQCKQRLYIKVSNAQDLQTVLTNRSPDIHIKIGEGDFKGPFIFDRNLENNYKVHIVGSGIGVTFLAGFSSYSNAGILDCFFNNSSISQLTILTPENLFTCPKFRRVEMQGKCNSLSNVEFQNSKLELCGEAFLLKNVTFLGDLKESFPRISGRFQNSVFVDTHIKESEMGISVTGSGNRFEKTFFHQVRQGFIFSHSNNNSVADSHFRYVKNEKVCDVNDEAFNEIEKEEHSDIVGILIRQGNRNSIHKFHFSVLPSSNEFAVVLHGFTLPGNFNEGCNYTAVSDIDGGSIWACGKNIQILRCKNIRTLDARRIDKLTVTDCKGEEFLHGQLRNGIDEIKGNSFGRATGFV